MGQGTRTIHNRLTDMKNSWENNEISASINAKRKQELEALENRWRNDGMLIEGNFREQDVCIQYAGWGDGCAKTIGNA